MGYDLPPARYAEPDVPEGRGRTIALWSIVGVLAVGAIVAMYMIFSGGSPGGNGDQLSIPSDIVGSDQVTAKQELVTLGHPGKQHHAEAAGRP